MTIRTVVRMVREWRIQKVLAVVAIVVSLNFEFNESNFGAAAIHPNLGAMKCLALTKRKGGVYMPVGLKNGMKSGKYFCFLQKTPLFCLTSAVRRAMIFPSGGQRVTRKRARQTARLKLNTEGRADAAWYAGLARLFYSGRKGGQPEQKIIFQRVILPEAVVPLQ